MNDDQAVPWAQQPCESGSAFHAFTHYRDLPPGRRSLDAGYRMHRSRCSGKAGTSPRAPGRWTAWSASSGWPARAHAWDEERDRLAREVEVEELQKTRRAWVERTHAVQEAGMTSLQYGKDELERHADPANRTRLTPGQARFMTKVGAEMILAGVKDEMLLRGEATQRTDAREIEDVFDAIAERAREIAREQLAAERARDLGQAGSG